MSKVVKGARFISKISEVPGVEPTVPPNDDHTLGWKDTDIYIGEWFWNVADSKIYFRDQAGVGQMVTPDPETGQIDPALLPGNYLGAMVYRGTWDASSGANPGVSTGILEPEKGDYWIVSVAGNTFLAGAGSDWEIGDYAICNVASPLTWDKIDNTEPTIYANNVLYDNSTYTSLANVDEALEMIFDTKFITPQFNNTVTIDTSSFSTEYTSLQLNGSDNKWINWDDTTLKLGTSSTINNSKVSFGPKTSTVLARTSTLDLHWLNMPGEVETVRWRMYSSNTDGYFQGYANNGTTVNTKISSMGDSYFNVGNLGVGGTPSGSYKLEVIGTIRSSSNVYAASNFISTTGAVVLSTNSTSSTVYLRPNGYSSLFNQSIFNTSLATIGTNMTVSGLMSSTTGNISGALSAGSVNTSGNVDVGDSLDVSDTGFFGGELTTDDNLVVNGISTLIGKASYTSTVSITGINDIVHRNYVDSYVLSHATGLWSTGASIYQFRAYDAANEIFVGINVTNPTYNLEVGSGVADGTAIIRGTLDVQSTLNANAALTVDGTLTAYGHTTLGNNTTSDTVTVNAVLNANGTLNANGNFTVDGNSTLGNASTDTTTVNGTLNIVPSTNGDFKYDTVSLVDSVEIDISSAFSTFTVPYYSVRNIVFKIVSDYPKTLDLIWSNYNYYNRFPLNITFCIEDEGSGGGNFTCYFRSGSGATTRFYRFIDYIDDGAVGNKGLIMTYVANTTSNNNKWCVLSESAYYEQPI